MATNHRRTIWRSSSPAFFVARVEATRHAIAGRPPLALVPSDRRQGDRQSKAPVPIGGTGQTDLRFATRSGPGRWDRFVSRIARSRTVSPAVIEADATLTAQIERYNRVREYQGREPLRREDFVDILDRPPTTGGRDA